MKVSKFTCVAFSVALLAACSDSNQSTPVAEVKTAPAVTTTAAETSDSPVSVAEQQIKDSAEAVKEGAKEAVNTEIEETGDELTNKALDKINSKLGD